MEKKMNDKKITPFLAKVFYLTYPLAILCVVVMILLETSSNAGTELSSLSIALVPLMVVFGWAWIISLGIVTSRLGKSWILWCGLSIIFSPISPLIIYFMMIENIKNALNQSSGVNPEV